MKDTTPVLRELIDRMHGRIEARGDPPAGYYPRLLLTDVEFIQRHREGFDPGNIEKLTKFIL